MAPAPRRARRARRRGAVPPRGRLGLDRRLGREVGRVDLREPGGGELVRPGVLEADPALEARPHQAPDGLVGAAEGPPELDQVVGQVGRGEGAARHRRGHAVAAEVGRGDHPGHRRQEQVDRVDGVEEVGLVLLQVLVVGERQAVEDAEQPGEVRRQARRLRAGQLGGVRVLLLGQHRRARGEGVVELDEAVLVAGPEDDLGARGARGARRAGPRSAGSRPGRRGCRPRRGCWGSAGRTRGPRPPRPGRRGSPPRPARPSPTGTPPRRRRSRAPGGRGRGRASRRRPAGGGPAARAGRAGRACSRAGAC